MGVESDSRILYSIGIDEYEGENSMATVIESMTGVCIKSPFFNSPKILEFFPDISQNGTSPKRNRVALMYGTNGSGKSTLAQGFREYAESTTPRSIDVIPLSGTDKIKPASNWETERIQVFDETYITNNVKFHRDGLGSIVLFGRQVQIEKRINEIETNLFSLANKIEKQEEVCQKYLSATDVASPAYWSSRMIKTLQRPNGWAETDGIQIKKHQIKTRVTNAEIKRIGQLATEKTEEEIKAEFERLISVFGKVNTSSKPIFPAIVAINVPYNILSITNSHLAQTPKNTSLTTREQKILDMMGVSTLIDAKGFLSITSNSICPQCLQPVSEQHRNEMLGQLEKILNRDIEDYQNSLRMLIIPTIAETQYDSYSCVDAVLVEKIRAQILLANRAIEKHNGVVMTKIQDPMGSVEYKDSHKVGDDLLTLNALLVELEKKRISFNKVIADREMTEKQLIALNDLMGHFAIVDDYTKMMEQTATQESDKANLSLLQKQEDTLRLELKELDAQRKNYKLAVDQINQSLSYIYLSKTRLEVSLQSDQLYHLKVNGQPVTPDKISCGERNALALCYFFTEIAKETDFDKMYKNEYLLVIDDPVSSFDVENRVGILSFLRFKLNQILFACKTTKILVMTHDISVLFDLQKAMDEISSACGAHGKNAEYSSYQLVNKELVPFLTKKHSEYTKLMEQVYDYACNPADEKDLTIGNITRRLFEAFSTFMFKEGIEKVTLNESVLSLISDQCKRDYFQNSMYRLVLHTESHSQEAMQGAPEVSLFSHISREEKLRTTRDVLCFMYSVNKVHILAHIPQAEHDILTWMDNFSAQEC